MRAALLKVGQPPRTRLPGAHWTMFPHPKPCLPHGAQSFSKAETAVFEPSATNK